MGSADLLDIRREDTVLFLGPDTSPVLSFLRQAERAVVATPEKIDVEFVRRTGAGFAVSHGYRHLVRGPVLEHLRDRVINLHVSYLPWNRGADPNLWSFLDDTPKGVTIHYMDEGLDTGDVIAQRRLEFAAGETLRTSYDKLQRALYELFVVQWPLIRGGRRRRWPQPPGGTSHRLRDKERVAHLLAERGWDTPVEALVAAPPVTPKSL
ncbi:MAG TPA: formyltransferase family protein [Gemmataceae bacterium]|nr:formyltransferase family protein [Gemmataceae bacterium]